MHDVDDLDRDAYEVEDDLFICSESFVGPPESPASEFFYGISASAPSMLGGRVNSDLVSARNICARYRSCECILVCVVGVVFFTGQHVPVAWYVEYFYR